MDKGTTEGSGPVLDSSTTVREGPRGTLSEETVRTDISVHGPCIMTIDPNWRVFESIPDLYGEFSGTST